MTFSLNSSILDVHEEICDYLLDTFAYKTCKIIYPQKNNSCPNCIQDTDTNASTGIYKTGGPVPFTNYTICPYCGGLGKLYIEESETVKLRVYFNQKQFVKIDEFKSIVIDNDVIQIIGYLTDLPKLERAKELIVDTPIEGYKQYSFQPLSAPNPWGFRQNRYFIQMWKRNN